TLFVGARHNLSPETSGAWEPVLRRTMPHACGCDKRRARPTGRGAQRGIPAVPTTPRRDCPQAAGLLKLPCVSAVLQEVNRPMDPRHDVPAPRARQSLRSKLIRTMVGTLSVVCAAVLVMVAVLHIWTVRDTLSLVEAKIRESIIRKGQGLVSNHAQALRGLVADNAFSDVRRLVEGTLREDPELIYGLFLGTDG